MNNNNKLSNNNNNNNNKLYNKTIKITIIAVITAKTTNLTTRAKATIITVI